MIISKHDIVENYLQSNNSEVCDFSDRNTSNNDFKNEQPLGKIERKIKQKDV